MVVTFFNEYKQIDREHCRNHNDRVHQLSPRKDYAKLAKLDRKQLQEVKQKLLTYFVVHWRVSEVRVRLYFVKTLSAPVNGLLGQTHQQRQQDQAHKAKNHHRQEHKQVPKQARLILHDRQTHRITIRALHLRRSNKTRNQQCTDAYFSSYKFKSSCSSVCWKIKAAGETSESGITGTFSSSCACSSSRDISATCFYSSSIS